MCIKSICVGNGPILQHDEPKVQREFINVYQELKKDIPSSRIVGSADGNDAEVGFIGEIISSKPATANTGATNVFTDIASIQLTTGSWLVNVLGDYVINTAKWFDLNIGISSFTGNTANGLVGGENRYDFSFSTNTDISEMGLHIANFPVVLSATTVYYLKSRAQFTSGQPRIRAKIWAIRNR